MIKIGYIGMSAKPYHAGHHFLVSEAAKECNEVKLFVSLADRKRDGEHFIKGEAMKEIWARYILAILPSNVNVEFVSSPVRSIYEYIGEIDKTDNETVTHIIYSEKTDAEKNYPEKNLLKYFPRLSSISKIEIKPFCRTKTVNNSGTTMRKYIQLGLSEDFIKGLPESIREHGMSIWKILGGIC